MDERKIGRRIATKLLDGRMHESWQFRFRASAMPFCQLKFAWFAMDKQLGELPGASRKFFADFYMDVGTALHSATQRWLARQGILFGNWMCEQPWCEHSFNFDQHNDPIPVVEKKLSPQSCPGCGKELVYCEFSFRDKPTGHCDGLIKYGDLTPEELDFVILEIKTTGERKLRTEVKVDGPPMEHKIQVTLYAHKLTQLGYNIKGVLFIFIPREDPRNIWPYWYPVGLKKAARIHESIVRDHKAARIAVKQKDFAALTGSCQTEADARNCPYRVNCFSPRAMNFFEEKFRRFIDQGNGSVADRLPVMPYCA